MKFFPHKPKIFDRVYYLLEEEFTAKTEFMHLEEDQKIISSIIFQYQIIPVQKKVLKEENSDTSPKTDSTAIASPVLLSPIPLNVDSDPEEFTETNSHVSSDFNDYPDEEYPSPTPIRPSSRSINQVDLDEEVSPSVIQAISDEIEADIEEYINRDTDTLLEELGDNADLRIVIVYDDEDDSSNSSDSDTNMLCDMSYVYGFDADLDLDELTDFLYFFM